jgi:hypothetical protein
MGPIPVKWPIAESQRDEEQVRQEIMTPWHDSCKHLSELYTTNKKHGTNSGGKLFEIVAKSAEAQE